MANSNEVFEYALSVLSTRRNKAKAVASERRAELYRHVPRLREIEAELAGTAAELVHTVIAGGEVVQVRKKNLALQTERGELLCSMGMPPDYFEPAYTCTICNDSGYSNHKMCTCMERLLREEKLARLNRASSLELASFSAFRLDYYPSTERNGAVPRKRMEEIYDICRQYASGFSPNSGKNMLMLGATGLGKTHLSLAIAAEVVAHGYEAVYGSVQDLFRRAEEERFSREGGTTLDTLLDCELLILDDLGAEFVTSFTSSVLYNLVNTRLNHKKPTIISTNLTVKELNTQYADRIVSRLLGNYKVLQFMGSDIRIALAGIQ